MNLFLIFTLALERNHPVYQGKQCIISTLAYPPARVNSRSPLTHNNASGSDKLAILTLNAKHFRLRIPAIPGTTYSFFMSHYIHLLIF
jgi:hypothetical protein